MVDIRYKEKHENIYDSGDKKIICLIIHSLGIGGMERVMSELANCFVQKGNTDVHLILTGINREVKYNIDGTIKIHRPPFQFRNSRRNFDTIRTIWFVRKKVQEIDPSTILSFGEMWNNLVLVGMFGLNYPVFISDRSQPDKNLGAKHNLLRNWLYPLAAGYIAQTQKAAEICKKRKWNRNVTVIGNPIRKIKPDPSIDKENIVLFVGRLIPTKHVDQLIRIFTEIKKPGWKLVIVGGDAKKLKISIELQKLIRKLGAENIVFLEGEKENVDYYYKRSEIFAFTSSSEGFPNVIGEALSAGLPVVAYDCEAGPADLIQNGENGFLIDLFDEEKFYEKTKKLMEYDELRKKMSESARNSIENFRTVSIANKFYSFITFEE